MKKKGLTKLSSVKIKCVASCATTDPEKSWKSGTVYSVSPEVAAKLTTSPHFITIKLT